jgi:hypothetical protein
MNSHVFNYTITDTSSTMKFWSKLENKLSSNPEPFRVRHTYKCYSSSKSFISMYKCRYTTTTQIHYPLQFAVSCFHSVMRFIVWLMALCGIVGGYICSGDGGDRFLRKTGNHSQSSRLSKQEDSNLNPQISHS